MRDYSQAAINLRDGYAKRSRAKHTSTSEKVSEKGRYLLKLIQVVPNWETYLTDVQLKSVKLYQTSLNVVEVAKVLKVDSSTTYTNLFGENNEHNKTLGALGRLLKAYNMLKESGYYDTLKKRQEMKRVK